jgi:lipoprotein-anchoring transpeptidase ErfK/SrfK
MNQTGGIITERLFCEVNSMLNKVVAVAILAAVFLSPVSTGLMSVAHAVTANETDAALVLKRKKASELKALEAQAAALQRKINSARKAADANLITGSIAPAPAVKKMAAPKKGSIVKVAAVQVRPAQKCTDFLQCLFGHAHRKNMAQVQTASYGPVSASKVMSGKTTSQNIAWNDAKYPVGSLIVKTPERALYYVSGKGEAIRYSVGVGREGMQWSGVSSIVSKTEWPNWTPPKVMIEREALKGHMIPPFMKGGPGNPLGARALYIGGRMYRVHGTNNEASIGGAVSSGCIRMMNADVIDLYNRVKIGARIYVMQ